MHRRLLPTEPASSKAVGGARRGKTVEDAAALVRRMEEGLRREGVQIRTRSGGTGKEGSGDAIECLVRSGSDVTDGLVHTARSDDAAPSPSMQLRKLRKQAKQQRRAQRGDAGASDAQNRRGRAGKQTRRAGDSSRRQGAVGRVVADIASAGGSCKHTNEWISRVITFGSNAQQEANPYVGLTTRIISTPTSVAKVECPEDGSRPCFVRVISAYHRTALISDSGMLNVWGGSNVEGNEKGRGGITAAAKASKAAVQRFPGLRNVLSVGIGAEHMLALTTNGVVYSWGKGQGGRLGHAQAVNVAQPRPVELLSSVKIVQVACGDAHSMVLSVTGVVYTFGSGAAGQLGLGDSARSSTTPIAVESLSPCIAIASGPNHCMAVARDGDLFAWGFNGQGRLGVETDAFAFSEAPRTTGGTTTAAAAASEMEGHNTGADDDNEEAGEDVVAIPRRVSLPYHVNVLAVACGHAHTMCIASNPAQMDVGNAQNKFRSPATGDDGGTLWAWGWNEHAQLGTGSENETEDLPARVLGLDNVRVRHVQCGFAHSAALCSDGQLRLWGFGEEAQLGLTGAHRETSSAEPTPLVLPQQWSILSFALGHTHTALVVSKMKGRALLHHQSVMRFRRRCAGRKICRFVREQWQSRRPKLATDAEDADAADGVPHHEYARPDSQQRRMRHGLLAAADDTTMSAPLRLESTVSITNAEIVLPLGAAKSEAVVSSPIHTSTEASSVSPEANTANPSISSSPTLHAAAPDSRRAAASSRQGERTPKDSFFVSQQLGDDDGGVDGDGDSNGEGEAEREQARTASRGGVLPATVMSRVTSHSGLPASPLETHCATAVSPIASAAVNVNPAPAADRSAASRSAKASELPLPGLLTDKGSMLNESELSTTASAQASASSKVCSSPTNTASGPLESAANGEQSGSDDDYEDDYEDDESLARVGAEPQEKPTVVDGNTSSSTTGVVATMPVEGGQHSQQGKAIGSSEKNGNHRDRGAAHAHQYEDEEVLNDSDHSGDSHGGSSPVEANSSQPLSGPRSQPVEDVPSLPLSARGTKSSHKQKPMSSGAGSRLGEDDMLVVEEDIAVPPVSPIHREELSPVKKKPSVRSREQTRADPRARLRPTASGSGAVGETSNAANRKQPMAKRDSRSTTHLEPLSDGSRQHRPPGVRAGSGDTVAKRRTGADSAQKETSAGTRLPPPSGAARVHREGAGPMSDAADGSHEADGSKQKRSGKKKRKPKRKLTSQRPAEHENAGRGNPLEQDASALLFSGA